MMGNSCLFSTFQPSASVTDQSAYEGEVGASGSCVVQPGVRLPTVVVCGVWEEPPGTRFPTAVGAGEAER
eukprot:9689695-Prorocentrum_lima.AAC.1